MKIGIIGAGGVGTTLGKGLAKAGHTIVYGVRDPKSEKAEILRAEGADARSVGDAVTASDVVILATSWSGTEAALASAGDFENKPLLDATNPIGEGFELTHGHRDSGGEAVSRWATNARVVKVFNTVGRDVMEQPTFGESKAAMLIAGDDEEARGLAERLAAELGFEPLSVGPLSAARYLEPVAMAWIKLAFGGSLGSDFAYTLVRR